MVYNEYTKSRISYKSGIQNKPDVIEMIGLSAIEIHENSLVIVICYLKLCHVLFKNTVILQV